MLCGLWQLKWILYLRAKLEEKRKKEEEKRLKEEEKVKAFSQLLCYGEMLLMGCLASCWALLGCSQWLPQLLLCSLRSSPSSKPCVGAPHSALLLGNERVRLDLVVLLHHLHRAGFLPVLFVGGGVPGLSVQFFPHLFFLFCFYFCFSRACKWTPPLVLVMALESV